MSNNNKEAYDMQNNLQQIIMSAQNAIRNLQPAIRRYEHVMYVSAESGALVGSHILTSITELETLIATASSAQKEISKHLDKAALQT